MEENSHGRGVDKGDVASDSVFKSEIDRLQGELVKSEKVIADSELLATNQEKSIAALTKQVEELTPAAEQADRLKDEMDEYRHTAERARKLEASVEKYKKKLEEAAEAKRTLKSLEDENITLLEHNARLEENNQSLAHLKEINEQYKQNIADLETRISAIAQEKEGIQLALDNGRKEITDLTAEKDRQAGDVALLEERLKQLEGQPKKTKHSDVDVVGDVNNNSTDEEDSVNELSGMANELDDAISGVTTTELKLRIRKLERELESQRHNKADSSRILVLESLLDDAQKMKGRYEQEFLREHKEKLILQRQMDEIRNGKSAGSNK